MAESVLGWDLGGAHVKAVLVDGRGRVQHAAQIPCALWQGEAELDRAVEQVLVSFPAARWHAITMTGELVDLFRDRAEGVRAIVDRFVAHVPRERVLVFAYPNGFLSPARAKRKPIAVASANWAASAAWTARRVSDALFIDVGSTTTDIVPIRDGEVIARGMTDATRLAHEELVYTGVVRTPLMAAADRVPFAGEWIAPIAEYFATTADVYRMTGELPDGVDQHPAADGGEKTIAASARRLARTLGRDADDASVGAWRACAHYFAEAQLWRVRQACERALSHAALPTKAPIVGAGVGRFLIEKLARRLERPYRDFSDLVACADAAREGAVHCAPAVAVALLAQRR